MRRLLHGAALVARKAGVAAMPFRKRNYLTCLAVLVGMLAFASPLLGCAKTARHGEPGSWTVCICMCGPNLESKQGWGTKTLDALRGVRVPKSANAIVQAGGGIEVA